MGKLKDRTIQTHLRNDVKFLFVYRKLYSIKYIVCLVSDIVATVMIYQRIGNSLRDNFVSFDFELLLLFSSILTNLKCNAVNVFLYT